MCKIDFSTTFLNKSFPHWLYDVLFVYGDIVYAIVPFFRMSGTIRVYEETRWNPNDEHGKHSNIFHPAL